MHHLSRVGATLLLAACAIILSACNLLDRLDPTRCVGAKEETPIEFTVEDFRVTQTNQFLDNSIPLLASRGAGLRVAIGADVPRATIGEMLVEVDLVTAAGDRSGLISQAYDCVRTQTVLSKHLGVGELNQGDRLELRVLDGAAEEVISEQMEPRFTAGELFRVVFVPVRINGVEVEPTEVVLELMASAAHAIFPAHETAEVFPLLDIGMVDGSGAQRSGEALMRLRQHVELWRADGFLPDYGVVIGLLPDLPGGTWGVGGGGSGVSRVERGMFLHELGHALGAPHAAGCGAPGPLPGSSSTVFPIGYDHAARQWQSGTDIMSYCHPRSWIGASLYALIVDYFERAQERGGVVRVATVTLRE